MLSGNSLADEYPVEGFIGQQVRVRAQDPHPHPE